MLEFVFVPHRRVVGLLLCISVGWAPSPFELAFGDEFYPSPFVTDNQQDAQHTYTPYRSQPLCLDDASEIPHLEHISLLTLEQG